MVPDPVRLGVLGSGSLSTHCRTPGWRPVVWPALGRDGVTEDGTEPGRAGLGKGGEADSIPGSGKCMGKDQETAAADGAGREFGILH